MFSVEQIDGGVRFGVASDLNDLFAPQSKSRRQIGGNGGFADTALSIYSYFQHISNSFFKIFTANKTHIFPETSSGKRLVGNRNKTGVPGDDELIKGVSVNG